MASNVAQGSTRLILIGAAVLLSIGMGLRQSIGLFLTPVTRDLALTAADFTLTIAIQNIVWGLAQAPAGAIGDRNRDRRCGFAVERCRCRAGVSRWGRRGAGLDPVLRRRVGA